MTGKSIDGASFDAVVVGGGFYGCAISVYLAEQRGLKKILLIEREASLLQRASYNNQARVHNGYHYPRSFTTAYRSRINLPLFVRDWPSAVKKDFIKLYAIARRNSKVNARQFQRFCKDIGASLEPADLALKQLFEPRLIEDVFLAQEYAFDTTELARLARRDMDRSGVDIQLESVVDSVRSTDRRRLEVAILSGQEAAPCSVRTRYLFNCTYSGLNQLHGDFPGTRMKLKHEITEMALMKMPPVLSGLGITVMDGPFFSIMPFPARSLHTLSHVRYTPHLHWTDSGQINPYDRLKDYPRDTRVDRMVRDVTRYLPAIEQASYVDSLFEIKTILTKNEGDDGRPILFEKHDELPGCISILGGKIDNIFDVLERLDAESFPI